MTIVANVLSCIRAAVLIAFLTGASSERGVERVVQENEAAVLVIIGTRTDTGAAVQGSGVCIDRAGYVLATAHQVIGVKNLEGRRSDGSTCRLTPLEVQESTEYALLKSEIPLPAARIGNADTLNSGAPLLSIAAPMNLEFSTVTGTVSHPKRTYRGYPVIQAVLMAGHGSSGGPVFDRDGALVGLISGELTEADFTIVNRINNAYSMLRRYGISVPEPPADDPAEPEIIPAPDANEREIRAIEAYNRGVFANNAPDKIEAYGLAVKLLPEFYEAWFNLAVAAAESSDVNTAEQAYRRAAALRPEAVEVPRNLGRLLLREKQFDAAMACFEQASRLAPDSPQSHNDLGEVYRQTERYNDAAAAFQAALRLNPDYAQAHYNLGLTYAAQARTAEAATELERYLALAPGAADAAEVQAWLQQLRQAP